MVAETDVATAYAVVSDVAGYGRFSPENRSAKWLGAASGPAPGARFRSWNRRGIVRWFTHCVVEAADGREFSFRVVFPPPMPKTRWTFRVAPIDAGHTRIEESWELSAPLGRARRAMMRLVLGVSDRPSNLTDGAAQTLTGMCGLLEQR